MTEQSVEMVQYCHATHSLYAQRFVGHFCHNVAVEGSLDGHGEVRRFWGHNTHMTGQTTSL